MKKSLLIAVAAIMVVLSVSAQQKRVAQATKMNAPVATKLNVTKAAAPIAKRAIEKNQPARRAAGVAGTYILDFDNYDGTFTESSSFEIVEKTGTVKIVDLETENYDETIDFEYNVQLNDFTWEGGVAYGKYDATEGTIHIPVQVIGENSTYGRIVLGGISSLDGEPKHYPFDMILTVDEDGALQLYDMEEELAEVYPGEIMSGWYSFLPDYEEGGAWNYGFDIEFFQPNAVMGGREVHIENGAWGEWTATTHNVSVEDYGTEIVVHNFFDLCPISITIDGDKASIATPVRVQSYDYADEGEEPNYIQIWQWDATLENRVNPGLITGNVSTDEEGNKMIEFYDTEYREAWTDEQGDHEAGEYIINDYTKWFMVHSNYGENGAYWWGEARNVYLIIPADGAAGITEAKATAAQNNAKVYNLLGQEVNGDVKGLVIKNGKKYVNK